MRAWSSARANWSPTAPDAAPDGSTTLEGFLTYGGETGLQQWLDVLLNVSPSLDMTLYGGILLLPLALVGLVTVDRRRLHFVVMAIVMLLFTLGTLISTAAFHVWPGMRFFRHIALVSPFVKVLLIFVAGIGFERLFGTCTDRRRIVRAAAIAAAIVLLAGAWLALDLAQSPSALPPLHGSGSCDRPAGSHVRPAARGAPPARVGSAGGRRRRDHRGRGVDAQPPARRHDGRRAELRRRRRVLLQVQSPAHPQRCGASAGARCPPPGADDLSAAARPRVAGGAAHQRAPAGHAQLQSRAEAVAAGPGRARHPGTGRVTPSSSPTRPDPRSGWTPGFALSIS